MTLSPLDALNRSRNGDPLELTWGLYIAPASQEGDGLLWFESPAALQDFVAAALWPALFGVAADPQVEEGLRELFRGGPAFSWALLEQVNHLLEPELQIHWWGNLRQLFEGEDPFARDLREAWRQGVGRGPQDFSALAPEQRKEFVGFLRTVFQ